MLKWVVFAVMWMTGLFVGDVLAVSGLGGMGSGLVAFGGMWMLACSAAKDCIAGYQEAKARRKTPNVAGNRLAEGKSELTGLLGGPARSERT